MVSEEQELKIRNEIKLCVEILINKHLNTYQISEATGIPQATVHRRLNDDKRIRDIYIKLGKTNEEIDEIVAEIKRLMELNKEQGLSKGGKTSQERYDMLRDNEGHYNGVVRK